VIGARDRTREGRGLSAAIAVEGGIGGENADEAIQLTALAGGEKLTGDLLALGSRHLEPRLSRRRCGAWLA
jgi:hypothetical protein